MVESSCSVSYPIVPPPVVSITGSPVDSDFFTGLRLTLICSIHIPQNLQSMPWTVSAYWTKAGSRIISNSRVIVEETVVMVQPLLYQSTLVFNSLDRSRDESGEYTCTASINSSMSSSAYSIEITSTWCIEHLYYDLANICPY